jgi:hypothetical protein
MHSRTAPSSRHPAGLPRCQARCRRGGHQCPRAARDGFPVCWIHGAGSAKREREGRRRNPKLAPLRHGFRSRRETVEALANSEPGLAKVYQTRLAEAGYTSVREERALAEALLHRFLNRADLNDPEALDAALNAMTRIAALKERQQRVERDAVSLGAEDLLRFLHALGRAINTYVPEGQRDEFLKDIKVTLGLAA